MSGTRLNEPDGIDEHVTTLHIYANSALPLAPFHLTFESGETVKVTAGGPRVDTLTVERGALGTTRVGHSNGERLIVSVDREVTLALESGGTSLPGVTSGPVPAPLAGVTPDPTYNPTYTFVSGDLATSDSYYGDALVHFVTWTPTVSGTVLLLPPADDGASQSMYFEVFPGTVIGTDVPSRDGSGTNADAIGGSFYIWTGANRTGVQQFIAGSFAVTAGQVYTLTIEQDPDSNAALPTGRVQSLLPWIVSTQPLGGQSHIVPWGPTATKYLAFASDDGQATEVGARASGLGRASAVLSDARNQGAASGKNSSAEGTSIASGRVSSARGEQNVVSSHAGSADGAGNTVTGEAAHGEGSSNTVSGVAAHVEGRLNVVSGDNAHGEGASNFASGFNSHVQGQESLAAAQSSDAMGDNAAALIRAEQAHASGSHVNQGDSEYRRIIPYHETTDATPTQINPGSGQPMPLGTNATWQLLIQITASRHDTPGTTACWSLAAAITTCGTPRIVGTPTVLSHHNDAAAAGWLVALSVDTTTDPANPALAITVTGQAAQNIYWTGTVHATHVGV